jgi:uncharacterized repeat protein (TIGR01451 family)
VDTQPVRPESSVALASGALRAAVERLERGETTALGVDIVGAKIRVEVLHSLESSEIRAVIAGLGGTVEGEIDGVLVQALVPFNKLEALEAHTGVQFVRPPLEANVPIEPPPSDEVAAPQNGGSIVGEEVDKTNAAAWHAAGYTGAGVKVGIVDTFNGTRWDNAVAAGELPATPAGTFCQVDSASCDIWTVAGDAQHGQAVAEVVHEMAPGAQLYLATVYTVTDLQAAVDYFDAQGVDIISRSLTAQYDGPGDGTGPIADVMDNAVADGMVWFNSAGNTAGDGSSYGSYWRGGWVSTDGDNWLDFAPNDELMGFGCAFLNGVRWSDFGAPNPTDYDVYVFNSAGEYIGGSLNDQTMGAPPLELDIPCEGAVSYLAINLYAPGNGTPGDVLEFMTNGGGLEYWQNPYSASGPASDTASPGALSLGAVDPPLGTSIAPYSSRGPTNDALYGGTARIKPDVSAAAGMASYTYGTFSGTSASTPTAAGAAALIIEAGVATTPAQVKTYLLNNAAVDRGAAGPDNDFGAGEIVLPQPPADLTITKTASPSDGSTVTTGSAINYTLTVSNIGDTTAIDVPIRDTIGTGLSLSSVTPGSGVTCSDTTPPEINCSAASIPTGESRTVTIVVTVTAVGGTVLNGARVDPANVIAEVNEDADDPSLDCTAVGEGDDLDPLTEPDNFDCTGHPALPDQDADTVPDGSDNCPTTSNPDQANHDADPDGDACDDDDDDDSLGLTRTSGGACPTGGVPKPLFRDCIEIYLATDPLDACPDVVGTPGLCPGPSCDGDDAWPWDVDVSRQVNIADVFKYKGKIGKSVGDPDYMQRLDLDASGQVNIADVFLYKGQIGQSCSNP